MPRASSPSPLPDKKTRPQGPQGPQVRVRLKIRGGRGAGGCGGQPPENLEVSESATHWQPHPSRAQGPGAYSFLAVRRPGPYNPPDPCLHFSPEPSCREGPGTVGRVALIRRLWEQE